jgi:hypothetical protein
MSTGSAVSGAQRALAWLSIGCAVVLTIVLVIVSMRHLAALVAVVLGVAVGAAGAWWLITEHPPRRWIGLGGAVVGLGIIVTAVLDAADGDPPLVRAALVLVLFVVTIGSARLAMVRQLHVPDALRPHAVTRPSHPVLICNPWSGGGKVEQFGLDELANELGVETVMLDQGLDLEQLARDAIARGADCLGMAGGDGSQAVVASIAVECGVPFVCVRAGTRNHFAQDLGLDRDDPRSGLTAFRDAVERRIDFGTVNDRVFVNNLSLGVYAELVQQGGYRDAKVETTKTMLPELLGKTTTPFDLQFATADCTEVDGAFVIHVSNNPYALESSLDTRATTPDRHRRARCHRPHRNHREGCRRPSGPRRRWSTKPQPELAPVHYRGLRDSLPIGHRVRRRRREALEMVTPIVFRIHPRGLRVLVPEGNLEAAPRRRARNVSLQDLLNVARGRP